MLFVCLFFSPQILRDDQVLMKEVPGPSTCVLKQARFLTRDIADRGPFLLRQLGRVFLHGIPGKFGRMVGTVQGSAIN